MKIKQLIFCFLFVVSFAAVQAQPPHLKKNGFGATQLIVNGKPFLMISGEVYNSSGSGINYMEKTMKAMKEANLNSLFVSVSWEIVEPKEGVFDFQSVDELLRIARENNLKLALLWFASWKNGLSPYAPEWVLNDTKRFVRVKNDKGQNTMTLSPFCGATRDADVKAFAELMKHLAKVDGKESTVVAVQIENEVGTLGQTRDFGPLANKAFESQVPEELISYLKKNTNSLEIEVKNAWNANGNKTKGAWAEVFGKNDMTDLFFMAWGYAQYLDEIARIGKRAYNIPMYANCWMPPSMPRPNHSKPGVYPSGGPVVMVLDIWKAGAPSIDILAPDIYGKDFKDQADNFHRSDNPLFIPETRAVQGPATFSFSQHDAISFSPFGIDNQSENVAEEYAFLNEASPLILKYQGSGKMQGFYKSPGDTIGREFKLNDDVSIVIHFTRPFHRNGEELTVNGKMPASYGFFVQIAENEFVVGGNNIWVSAKSTNTGKEVWLKDAREGNMVNDEWDTRVIHNGDEASFLWSKMPVYRIKAYGTTPSKPAIFKFKTLLYDL